MQLFIYFNLSKFTRWFTTVLLIVENDSETRICGHCHKNSLVPKRFHLVNYPKQMYGFKMLDNIQ